MKIINLEQIKQIINNLDINELIKNIEDGFIEYSNCNVNVPPVGYLGFDNPSGDVHIKYGYIKSDSYYVIKIASGFYENAKLNISVGNGLMIIFDKMTGTPICILLDEGYLTDLRTAIAGAVVAKHFAPKNISSVGIIGTGIQSKLQLKYLKNVIKFDKVYVWGRTPENIHKFITDTKGLNLNVQPALSAKEIGSRCNMIVTTTNSSSPLLFSDDVNSGTHITAVGTDSPGKQEIDQAIFAKSHLIIADSISQCIDHGDISYALKDNLISTNQILELGACIKNKNVRKNQNDISVADLTGVAVQDIVIAKSIYLKITD